MRSRRDIKVVKKPLFRASDLTRRTCWKSLRERRKIYPEIHYVIDTSASDWEVEDVEIRIFQKRKSRLVRRRFEAYEPLLPSFWSKLYGDDAKLLPDFHPGFYPELGILKDHEVGYSIASERWPPVVIFERILDYCHTVGGAIKLTRNQFALWLCRLHWVAYDIDRMLSFEEKDWHLYQKEIAEIVSEKYSNHYEYYNEGRWRSMLNGKSLRPEHVLKKRLTDARQLLNLFFSMEIEHHDAPAMFLQRCYVSFGRRLCRDGLLIRCAHCLDFALSKANKEYCTEVDEGVNHRGAAKYRRHYAKHGEEIREKSRKAMREDRRFLKERGV